MEWGERMGKFTVNATFDSSKYMMLLTSFLTIERGKTGRDKMDRGEKTGRAALRSRGSNCSTFMEFFFFYWLYNSNGLSGGEANGEIRRNTA